MQEVLRARNYDDQDASGGGDTRKFAWISGGEDVQDGMDTGICKRQALLYIGHDEEDRRIALSSHPCGFFRAVHTDVAVVRLGSKGAMQASEIIAFAAASIKDMQRI